jgi:hypothetical protein
MVNPVSICIYFYKLVINNWYVAYFYLGGCLPNERIRKVYNKSRINDFSVDWDLYYLNLTLEISPYPRVAKLFLLVYGNVAIAMRIIRDANWVYEVSECDARGTYELYFTQNRQDHAPFLGFQEVSVTKKSGLDLINALKHTRPSFSFRALFKNRIEYYSSKFVACSFPRVIIFEEARSLEYRALYDHLKDKEAKIEFSWRNASSSVYTAEQLSSASNLDYPGYLHRPKYVSNIIIKLASPIIINDNILIVVPTFNSAKQIIDWIYSVTKIIVGNKYFFSVHPSYPHLKKKLLELGIGEIDENKSKYLERYSTYVGCVSTLLKTAKENGKQVYSIGFDEYQIDYMSTSLSDFQIIDCRECKF